MSRLSLAWESNDILFIIKIILVIIIIIIIIYLNMYVIIEINSILFYSCLSLNVTLLCLIVGRGGVLKNDDYIGQKQRITL